MLPANEQLARIRQGTTDIIPLDELEKKLGEDRPLRVKLGVDPTAPDIHLGHTVGLSKLRCFQDLGHHAVLIIGDFTARIGDPSGRSSTRPQLDAEAITAAAATYQQQIFKILDRDRVEVRFNSEWLGALGFEEVIRLCGKSTVARMLERDDFARRHAEGIPIGIHEFLYPLMQAHDSVVVGADVELGGSDQTFNILLGRQLQKDAGQSPQVAVILPLLEGTDGVQKMSKSLGNTIGVADSPDEMFGKVMSVADPLMWRYYELLSSEDPRVLQKRVEVGELHPMDAKKALAEMLVARFHGVEAGRAARRGFQTRFQERRIESDKLEELVVSDAGETIALPALMRDAGLVRSNSEARRLIKQRGVRIDGKTVQSENPPRGDATVVTLEVGKRRAVRLRFE